MTPTPPASGQDAASEVEAARQLEIALDELARAHKFGPNSITIQSADAMAAALRASAEQVRVLTGEASWRQALGAVRDRQMKALMIERDALRARAEKAEAALRMWKNAAIGGNALSNNVAMLHGLADALLANGVRKTEMIRAAYERAAMIEHAIKADALAAKTEADHG